MGFAVLVVCTGNVCRSPAAELLLRAAAAPASARDAGLTITSVGTAALVGEQVSTEIATRLAARGVVADDHRARQFEPWMAADADLVLAASREHAERVMREVPQSFRRVFTLREFARVSALVPAGAADPVAAVAAVAAARGAGPAPLPGSDDIADPFRRGMDAAEVAVSDIARCSRAVLDYLGLAKRRPLPRPR